MIRSIIILITVFAGLELLAVPFDSLYLEGKVIDADSGTPVSAKITYESLPYGSKIGFRKGSEFNFVIEKGEEYTITVMADGYISTTIKVTHQEYAGAGKIIQEIKLSPSRAGKIMRLESLNFGQGSDEITSEMFEELDKLVEMLENTPTMKIQLEGHTDYLGDAKLNMKLSEDRVRSIREYLYDKGIAKDRITIKAFGGSKPLSTESSQEAHAMNRRVEVRIISN
ncbi:MAG: OmpA family protein [Cyclobacteriaceae bacterium]|nr:OmpA family protein [Cyclobacteriaceae bacterium]